MGCCESTNTTFIDNNDNNDHKETIQPPQFTQPQHLEINTNLSSSSLITSSHPFDLSIFDGNTNKVCDKMCKINDSFDDICSELKRFITAHDYYVSLDVHSNYQDQQMFIKFINEIYRKERILNDYEHLLKQHKDNIYEINKLITKTSNCKLSHCAASGRHYSRHDRDFNIQPSHGDNEQEIDGILLFYCDLFDGVHFLLMHAFESGIRIVPNKYRIHEEMKDIQHDEDGSIHDTYFDFELKKLTEEIKQKKSELSTENEQKENPTMFMNNRYDAGQKFNIGIGKMLDSKTGTFFTHPIQIFCIVLHCDVFNRRTE